MGASILVADDEAGIRDVLKWELENSGHEVTVVANGHEAVEALRRAEFDVVISDVRMPGLSGLEVLKSTKELSPDSEVLVATGYAELETAVECVRGGAFDFVQKPFDMNELLATVARALERRELRAATALYQASQAIFATKEPQRLPEVIVDVAMKVMDADDVSLMVPDAERQLVVLYSHGMSPELQAVRTALGERVAGRVAVSREPALLTDGLAMDPRFADVPSFGRVRSSIVYPLYAGDRLLGVLNINRLRNERRFRKQDLERASVLASQVSLALENVRLVHQVAASERLAAVGQLAAGVAHEINNPVSCVLAGHSYLRERMGDLNRLDALFEQGADLHTLQAFRKQLGGRAFLEEMSDALGDAEEGAVRVRDIVRDMRSLARSDDAKRGIIDVNDPIRSALRVAGAELRHRAKVTVRLGEHVDVVGSAGRLSQVFLNLVVNAAQAFGDRPAQANEIEVTSVRDGNDVLARVADNGPGIPPQHLPRIFEAFFTTKGASTGTGLGLSISRDIVRSHGGDIRVESTPGRGATFTVVLLAAEASTDLAQPTERAAAGDGPPALAHGPKLRVLFVDDERIILRTYERAFGQTCEVVTAEGGQRALAVLAERKDFNLIVCDLLMPDVSGMEVYRRAKEAHPELEGIFVLPVRSRRALAPGRHVRRRRGRGDGRRREGRVQEAAREERGAHDGVPRAGLRREQQRILD